MEEPRLCPQHGHQGRRYRSGHLPLDRMWNGSELAWLPDMRGMWPSGGSASYSTVQTQINLLKKKILGSQLSLNISAHCSLGFPLEIYLQFIEIFLDVEVNIFFFIKCSKISHYHFKYSCDFIPSFSETLIVHVLGLLWCLRSCFLFLCKDLFFGPNAVA